MARSEIPSLWRERVCAVLANGVHGKQIVWTDFAAQRFESDSFGCWLLEAKDAFIDFLSAEKPMGCPVEMDDPPGETYEFIFLFKGRDFYGKILLLDDLKSVVVFSAHRPLKPKLRCD